mgnify:CR=1 FL=1
MKLTGEFCESLYSTMVKIRRFDEKVAELFLQGIVKGTAHSYVGQEAVAAGACANLREDDFIVSNHRGHGHTIAKGARMDRMMAELMGREDGYCRGLGGSMHIAALDLNILGCNGIVAAGVPIGAGASLAAKIQGTDRVALTFFGDGGANQGVVHETMNLASVWKLPFIFLCENNEYALSTDTKRTTAGEIAEARVRLRHAARAGGRQRRARGVRGRQGGRGAGARAASGPTFVEAVTYRWGGHSMRANLPDYRTKEEEREWIERDPIVRFGHTVVDKKALTPMRLKELEQAVELALDEAVRFGTAQPGADRGDDGSVGLRPTRRGRSRRRGAPGSSRSTRPSTRRSTRRWPGTPRVFVMGEDVGLIGGIFQVTKGLRDRFGEHRRARHAHLGGDLRRGRRRRGGVRPAPGGGDPDLGLHRDDDGPGREPGGEVPLHAGGTPTVPLVIRGPQGGGIRLAAQHSQSLEAWFTHVPGWS